jgi:hypothetical protein
VIVIKFGKAKCPLQQDLASGGAEKVGSADDFGDLHGGIINYDGELVSGNIISTPYEEVTEVAACRVALRAEM